MNAVPATNQVPLERAGSDQTRSFNSSMVNV